MVLQEGPDGGGAVVDGIIIVSVVDGGRTVVRWVHHRCMWAGEAREISVVFFGGEVEAGLVQSMVSTEAASSMNELHCFCRRGSNCGLPGSVAFFRQRGVPAWQGGVSVEVVWRW